ncbi:hypothetical protein INR49_030265 [Caranx melampygus]|nr:hypothetical protein INR49_030265 [Caranx melampygus]
MVDGCASVGVCLSVHHGFAELQLVLSNLNAEWRKVKGQIFKGLHYTLIESMGIREITMEITSVSHNPDQKR